MLNKFINDEAGFIVSAELVLILTLMFCAVGVGVAVVRDALVTELGDLSEAVGALNQSYNFGAIQAPGSVANTFHASCNGSGFTDRADECDCKGIVFLAVAGKTDPSIGTLSDGANAPTP